MASKIIFLNGPAGSGKDSVGNFLINKLHKSSIYKFATPIKQAVAAFFNLSPEEYQFYFETQEGKNNPSPRFFGKTPRQWLIGFSEDYAKEYGGRDVFGKLLSTNLRPPFESGVINHAIITDSGFQEEAEAVVNAFGKEVDYYLIRLHRNGFNFEGDSRNYIYLEKEYPFIQALDVSNEEGRIEHAVDRIASEVNWDDSTIDMWPNENVYVGEQP